MANTQNLPPLPPLPITVTDDIRKSHGFTDKAHWVIPGRLMQGSRPGFGLGDDTTMQSQIKALVKDAGIRTFVCAQAECAPEENAIILDDGGDRKPVSKDLPQYANEVMSVAKEIGDGITPAFLYYGILGDQPAKSLDGLTKVASDLADRIKAGETIYIHCGGGAGRAGLLSASVLGVLYQDLDAEQALEYTKGFCQLRNLPGREAKHYNSPETDSQRDQVREFYAKLRSQE